MAMSGRPSRTSWTLPRRIPRSSDPSSSPIESVAVRYWFACLTIRLRIRFFAQAVSTPASTMPTSTSTMKTIPTAARKRNVEIVRTCRTMRSYRLSALGSRRSAFGSRRSALGFRRSALGSRACSCRSANREPKGQSPNSRPRAQSREPKARTEGGPHGPPSVAVFAHELEETIEIERFFQKRRRLEVVRAGLVERRQHNRWHERQDGIGLLDAPELPAVHDRHHQVEQDDVRRVSGREIAQRFFAVGHGCAVKAFKREQLCHHLPQVGVVLHDQHGTVSGSCGTAGVGTRFTARAGRRFGFSWRKYLLILSGRRIRHDQVDSSKLYANVTCRNCPLNEQPIIKVPTPL